DRVGALPHALAVDVDLLLHLVRRDPDGERAEAESERADLAVPVLARRRAPQRRVRLLYRLRLHPTPRHLPVLAFELVLLVGPATDHVLDGFLPHVPGCLRVDAETFELGARRRPPSTEVDAPVRDDVEDRD